MRKRSMILGAAALGSIAAVTTALVSNRSKFTETPDDLRAAADGTSGSHDKDQSTSSSSDNTDGHASGGSSASSSDTLSGSHVETVTGLDNRGSASGTNSQTL